MDGPENSIRRECGDSTGRIGRAGPLLGEMNGAMATRPETRRICLDGVALLWWAVGGVLVWSAATVVWPEVAAAGAGNMPGWDLPSWLGNGLWPKGQGAAAETYAQQIGRWLLEPLGFAAAVLLLGWFHLGYRLTVRRSWLVLAVRAVGWGMLTVAAAGSAERWLMGSPPGAWAGPGGTLGVVVWNGLEEIGITPEQVPWLLAGAGLVGVMLVAGRWIRRGLKLLLRLLWHAGKGLLWCNARVADLSELVLRLLAAVGRGVVRAARWLGRLLGWLGRPLRWLWWPLGWLGRPLRWRRSDPATPPATGSVTGTASTDTPSEAPLDAATQPDDPSLPEAVPIHHVDSQSENVAAAVPTPLPPPAGHAAAPTGGYEFPPLSLLADPDPFPVEEHQQKLREVAALLEKTCQDFGVAIKVIGIHTGPVITQYEVALETGLRLNKVTALADDLALNLKVPAVRVVAPLPGRNTVGIEVPNEIRQTVRLKEVVAALASTPKVARYKLPIFLGKDVEGRPLAYDLAAMPHLLIAGRTGTGKSVCLNIIIVSLLLTRSPEECRLILIDPKKVELSDYARIPHLMTPVVTDEKKAEAILAWAVDKMEERYEWLHRARVRNVAAYNELSYEEIVRRIHPENEEERQAIPRRLPYIVIVIDEVADLILRMKKEIEGNIILLAQKSRAAGIHLVLATQKPTVDVVTGLIKSNLPARICFQVASRSDSAVVLDEKGAERLLGHGDMLFLQPGTSTIIRVQGALIEDKEIERVVNYIATDSPNYESELLNLRPRDSGDGPGPQRPRDRDPLYEQAVEIVLREQRGSTSLLQRALGIGYGKAARFIDYMAEDGIVGPYNGSNARQVLISYEEWQARKGGLASEVAAG